MLPLINSFEEYEKFKLNIDILKKAAKKLIQQLQLPEKPLLLFSEGTNIVFAYDNCKVIKIFPPYHLEQFNSERLVLKHLQRKLSINTPNIEYEGKIDDWPYIIMNQLDGILLETLWEKMDLNNKMIIIRELGTLIQVVHSLTTELMS